MLGGDPAQADAPELLVVRAQVQTGLEKPAEAQRAMTAALAHKPPSIEALWSAASAARAAHQDARAAELALKAVAINPDHWPSLLLLGDLALRTKAVSPARARDLLEGSLKSLASEASPTEQCQALDELARIHLVLQNIAGVFQTLNRGGQIDELSRPVGSSWRGWTSASVGPSRRWASFPPRPRTRTRARPRSCMPRPRAIPRW